MARIRSIHPGIFTDEAFMAASPHAKILILALGCWSDYANRFEWNEAKIAEFSNIQNIGACLSELEEVGAIVRDSEKTGVINFKFGFSRVRVSKWEAVRSSVFLRDDYACVYCGSRATPLHCDHVVPVSRGGSDDIGNLATSCAPCNLSKGDKLLEEWRS